MLIVIIILSAETQTAGQAGDCIYDSPPEDFLINKESLVQGSHLIEVTFTLTGQHTTTTIHVKYTYPINKANIPLIASRVTLATTPSPCPSSAACSDRSCTRSTRRRDEKMLVPEKCKQKTFLFSLLPFSRASTNQSAQRNGVAKSYPR